MTVDRPAGAVVGVDLGGTKVAAALLDANGETVRFAQRPHAVGDSAAAVHELLGIVREITDGAPVAAVGIAIAGWLSADRTLVRAAVNLGMRELALPAILAEALGVDVHMYNDGDATAFAEYRAAAVSPRSLLALTVGTGLGAGLVIDGKLIAGGTGLGAELGHQQTHAELRRCVCGGMGCAELYASGGGVAVLARERLQPEATSADVLRLARSGDPVALTLLENAGRTLGQVIGMAVPLVDPDLVVIGGGFGVAAADLMSGALWAELDRRRSMTEVATAPEVVVSELGFRAAALGAAALVRRKRSAA